MTQIIYFGFCRKATDCRLLPFGGFSRSNPNIIENNAQQKSVKSVQSVVEKIKRKCPIGQKSDKSKQIEQKNINNI